MYVQCISNPFYKYGSRYFFTMDWISFFVLQFIFDINRHLVKWFGEQWAGRDGVSQVNVFHFVTYLPQSIIVDDKGTKMLPCAIISSNILLVFATLLDWLLEFNVGKGCTTSWRAWLVDVACNTGTPVLVASIFSIHKFGTLNWLNP